MQRKNKKTAIWIIAVVAILLIINVLINIVAKYKIEKAVENFPSHINLTYKSIAVNVLSGNVALESAEFKVRGQTTDQTILEGQVKRLSVNNLSLWDYLVNSKISLNSITVEKPIVQYSHDDNRKTNSDESNVFGDFKTAINLDKLVITDADIIILKAATDSLLLSCPDLNFEISKVKLNLAKTLAESKFEFIDFQLKAQQLTYNLNDYEALKIDSIMVSDDSARFNKVSLKTKYSKSELSQKRAVERDHYNVNIKEITLKDMAIVLNPDFSFNSSLVKLTEPEASIYRDKRLLDDHKEKPLYSKSLRALGFKLGLDEVEIQNGKLIYEERVKSGNQSGSLRFSKMQVNVKNLGNRYAETEATEIIIAANFMEATPLKVSWNFMVQDSSDHFIFEADLGYFKAETINPFSVPNLSARFTGELNQTYFTISGGPQVANIDLKMKYEDFKVTLLDDEGKEEKKFLSGLVNIFIKKNSASGSEGYRYGYADEVERDQTKSVFNFIWLNTQEALRSAITDGEKEEN